MHQGYCLRTRIQATESFVARDSAHANFYHTSWGSEGVGDTGVNSDCCYID